MRCSKNKLNQNGCPVCKQHTCVDEKVPKIKCKINTDTCRVTRSVTKLMRAMNNFLILEIYRCMPLLGNEKETAPGWDAHIVHYSLVIVDKRSI